MKLKKVLKKIPKSEKVRVYWDNGKYQMLEEGSTDGINRLIAERLLERKVKTIKTGNYYPNGLENTGRCFSVICIYLKGEKNERKTEREKREN